MLNPNLLRASSGLGPRGLGHKAICTPYRKSPFTVHVGLLEERIV